MTFEQIQKAYEQMQRIKAENEIKAGDWAEHDHRFFYVNNRDIDIIYDKGNRGYNVRDCKKVPPTHIQALNEIYEGMK